MVKYEKFHFPFCFTLQITKKRIKKRKTVKKIVKRIKGKQAYVPNAFNIINSTIVCGIDDVFFKSKKRERVKRIKFKIGV